MREYFKAFKTQNITHRDYRPYFKPVLSYLEGAWTMSTDALEESFASDRWDINFLTLTFHLNTTIFKVIVSLDMVS